MSRPNSLKSVSSIVVLKSNGTGFQPVEVYKGDDVSRSTSRKFRPLEKFMVRTMRAQAVAAENYLDRHVKSADRKKNGWLKDAPKNLGKSVRRGSKQLKIKTFKIF